MKFSIITVCLNAGDDLQKTVKSTLSQSFQDFEIIVKDGFSKDGSVENLPDDSHIKVIQRKDSGIYDAMNQGIECASGEWIIFMNAGDLFYDSKVLYNIEKAFNDHPTAKIVYGKSYNEKLAVFDNCPPSVTKYFCYRSMICHQATVYSGELLKSRGYDTGFKISADRERLLYAVCKEGVSCEFIPVNIARFQGGGLSEGSKARELVGEENVIIKQRYFTKKEIRVYDAKYMLTLPHLRKLMTKNQTSFRIYRKIVGCIYHTKAKE